MLILYLIILKTCKAFNLINLNYTFYTRVSTIILISSSILIYNTLDLTFTVTSGIGIYGGLYHVTLASQIIALFLLYKKFITYHWIIPFLIFKGLNFLQKFCNLIYHYFSFNFTFLGLSVKFAPVFLHKLLKLLLG